MNNIKYLVIGDHPIFKRPDRVFVGEDADIKAEEYADELRKYNYENVEMRVIYDS
jgi:hypothetical protein